MGMSVCPAQAEVPHRTFRQLLAEINVTPLVDVMLVLLIIFMISAPMMQQGIQVDLPKANPGALNEVPDQIVLLVNKSRQISINGNAIETGTSACTSCGHVLRETRHSDFHSSGSDRSLRIYRAGYG